MADLAGIKAIFTTKTPKLVLATYRTSVTDSEAYAAEISALKEFTSNEAKKANIAFHEWTLPLAPKNGTPSTSPSAQIFQQVLDIPNVHTASPSAVPALLAVDKGELCDMLKGMDDVKNKYAEFISKFSEHLKQKKANAGNPQASVGIFKVDAANPTAASVDVAKLVEMGKNMMQKGQPIYAEKFFIKALGVLDAVSAQVDSSEGTDGDLEGSIAMTLAWLCMAQLVQDKPKAPTAVSSSDSDAAAASSTRVHHHAHNNEACDRLEKQYAAWITPYSDCARAVTLRNLARYLPLGAEWDGLNCSVNKITAELKEISPAAAAAGAAMAKRQKLEIKGEDAETKSATALADRVNVLRSLLVITYFLRGDMERSITEAIKLHVMKAEFGTVAMDSIVRFLGEEDALVQRSGWLVIKGAGI